MASLLVLLVLHIRVVSAARVSLSLELGASQHLMIRRHLEGASECPIKDCRPSACGPKKGLWTCTACSKGRTPSLPTSTPQKANAECVCPEGTTQDKKGSCVECALGFYCLQPADNKPATVSRQVRRCPANTVTRRRGAKTLYSCVNNKGYFFLPKMLKLMKAQALKAKSLPDQQQQQQLESPVDGKVAAAALSIQVNNVVAPCGPDSYSTGLEYQTECTPCPEGFHTDPDNPIGSHTSPAVCVLAPGTYSPDNVTVSPCPQGEFADTYALRDSCTPCDALLGPGITTQGTGSTSANNCSILQPGYALVDAASPTHEAVVGPLPEGATFSAARPCPQNYSCQGGDPAAAGAPTRCPRGLWTQVDDADDGELEAGASSIDQCVAPPGWFDPGEGLDIRECPSGTFKEDWGNAAACTPCGEGPWLSDRLTQLRTFDLAGNEAADVMVRGSSSSCYVQAGMGVIRKAVGQATVFQALVCPPNFYGTDEERRFGLELLPCLACPLSQITYGPDHRATTYLDADGANVPTEEGSGYYSPLACVNQPGYGYTAAGSQQCDLGTFSPGLDMAPCRDCPFATTTLQHGSTSAADCAVYARGYGRGRSGNAVSCPIGAYSDGTVPIGSPCTPCGNGRSTTDPGSESLDECRICALGYGGEDINHCKPCGQGTYGPRKARGMDTECMACPTGRVYKFHWESEYEDGDDFAPWATSPMLASSSSQCLAAFSQTVEGNVWLDLTPGPDFAQQGRELTSIQSCARDCYNDDGCAAVSYSYSGYTCWLWRPSSGGSSYSQSGGIALKTVLSNYRAESAPGDADKPAAAGDAAMSEAAAPSPGIKALQSNKDQALKAATMGTGFYTFWPGADAASALDNKSLQDVAGAVTLLDCLRECNMRNLYAGVVFGALDTATMALQGIQGAGNKQGVNINCQQVIAQLEVTGMRTLIRAKDDALSPV